jgi:hypothetical protein
MNPTRRVPLAAIVVDPRIQQRSAGLSQKVTDEYSQAMSEGNEFPPLVVFSSDGIRFINYKFIRVRLHRIFFYLAIQNYTYVFVLSTKS